MKIPVGTENPSLPIYCRSLSGAALTGKVAADFIELWYMREGGAKVDVDPAGITEVAGGEYRQTFPTAASAAGANYVTIGGEVDGGVVLGIPIELDTSATPGGIYTQTVTVTSDGATPIPNATVQIWSGNTLVSIKTTNALGIASPQSNAGEYTLKVACPEYNDYSSALTVAGNATRAVILTAFSLLPPADPNAVTGWIKVYRGNTTVEPGAAIQIQQVTMGSRLAYDSEIRTWVADANGVASGVVWADGSTYVYRRGSSDTSNWSEEFTPEDDGIAGAGTYQLPGVLGES